MILLLGFFFNFLKFILEIQRGEKIEKERNIFIPASPFVKLSICVWEAGAYTLAHIFFKMFLDEVGKL